MRDGHRAGLDHHDVDRVALETETLTRTVATEYPDQPHVRVVFSMNRQAIFNAV
jgi:hypothetical protein